MSDERKDDWESVLQAMRCEPIRHHIHDRELMVYWADRIGAAVRRKVYELESQLKKSMMLNEAWASAKPGVGVGVVTIEERPAAGNAAKMREALERLDKWASKLQFGTEALEAANVITPALAAPPRNCDVGTALEQAKRFKEFCDEHTDSGRNPNCGMCPILIHHETKDACQFYWGQMPCESPEDPEKRGAE